MCPRLPIITYSDLIQAGILIVICGLVYQLRKKK